ncbi:MAG: hypothetical protein PHS53_01850 [Candidatus Pacebacteria bacterium]|nr:hypothetical protein [Candidatus Paceibacterota bacterium]MDD5356871.1 hypothetical protein [Candidatus Paceibacterota bacterium]
MKPPKIVTAIFVNPEELFQKFPPRHTKLFGTHSSIAYDPVSLDDVEVGKHCTLKIMGRVSDEKCDVLIVENKKSKLKYPHITLSCSPTGHPIESNELLERAMKGNSVEYLKEPISIEGVEGYWDGDIKHI